MLDSVLLDMSQMSLLLDSLPDYFIYVRHMTIFGPPPLGKKGSYEITTVSLSVS